MAKVKKIKILRYARFQAIIAGFAGIVAGLIYSVGGTIYDLNTVGWNHGSALAYIAIPVMPIYFAVFGFIAGIVGAFLYNHFAPKWMRRMSVDFER